VWEIMHSTVIFGWLSFRNYVWEIMHSTVIFGWLLFRNYVWEIMHSTIRKMSKHVEKLQKEAEEARDLLDAHKKKVP